MVAVVEVVVAVVASLHAVLGKRVQQYSHVNCILIEILTSSLALHVIIIHAKVIYAGK